MVSASQLWTQYAHPPQPVAMPTLPRWKCESKQMLPLICCCKSSLSQKRRGARRGTMNFLLKSSVWLGPCIKGRQGACGKSIHEEWFIQYRWLSSPLLRDLWCSWGWIKTHTRNTRFWARVKKHKIKHFQKEIVNPGCLTREFLHTALKKRDSIVG